MDLNHFHLLVGQTIMYCQVIEHDVKRIYAAMHKGDYYNNLSRVEKWTLGKAVQELKALDFSDGDSYISASDYNFLKQMTEKRNHWCHESYQEFLYNKQFLQSKEYADECRKLKRDNERLSSVCNALEEVRIKAQKQFRNM
ncbi:MAG: hypothetical protein K2K13_05875 [Clostridiales bacterium]|nr:hypothetical protein [Clostridiales bacterium]